MDKLTSIRGAITVGENNVKEIKNATAHLLNEILNQNKLNKEKIINIIFTVTDDIDAINPATVAREEIKFDSIPMLCVQEMTVKGGLPKCIRVMLNAYTSNEIKHVYLGSAGDLRPDLKV